MRYFLGLGSNIEPHTQVPLLLRTLRELTPVLTVGRVVETAPVHVAGAAFLNVPVCLDLDLSPQMLKRVCNAIETAFGRDRRDPSSKTLSRRADLDILFWLADGATAVPADWLPDEPYMRPMLLELLAYLGISAEANQPELPPGVSLILETHSFGLAPQVLR